MLGCAVPIAISLYICLESRPIISPLILFAISTATVLFPLAVGPIIAIELFIGFKKLIYVYYNKQAKVKYARIDDQVLPLIIEQL